MAKERQSWQAVEQRLKKIVAEKLGVEEEQATLDANLVEDLGADSLDQVELIMAVEDEFDIEIPDETAERMGPTLADAIRTYTKEFPRETLGIVDTKILSFRVRPDGTIEVRLKLEDGSWTYADGRTLLPSMLYLVTLSRWGHILKELEDLINNPKTKESDLQRFFEEYPELVAGDKYDEVIPQATISREDRAHWKADFVLAPVNQAEFSKILELKLPKVPLTLKPRRAHISFSAKIWAAISQLRDYGRAFDSKAVRKRFKDKYEVDVYKPDLHLIAGRRWNFQWLDNIQELRKTTPIRIEDWDSALDRLKRRYE